MTPLEPRSWLRCAALCAALALGSSGQAQSARPAPQGLTAFRPQQGTGYFPFARTKVPEALEEHPELGPGIRANGALESDPAGEDDLIELLVAGPLENADLVLQRSGPELAVWSTRTKVAGTALAFSGGRTAPLAFGGAPSLTLWVEWTAAAPGLATLALRALEPDRALDRLVFHAFQGLVVALGGEGQVPGLPLDPNHGTFVVATELYRRGHDLLMRDEDEVDASGAGPVYTEVVNAIQHRGVAENPTSERGRDFAVYRPFLEREPPAGLVRYLLETDPDAALLALTRAQVTDLAELRALLWAWHELADLRWKLSFGFLARAELPGGAPEAVESLGVLARHPRWWARCAAAQFAREEPGLRERVPLEVLGRDGHPLVRALARAASEAR